MPYIDTVLTGPGARCNNPFMGKTAAMVGGNRQKKHICDLSGKSEKQLPEKQLPQRQLPQRERERPTPKQRFTSSFMGIPTRHANPDIYLLEDPSMYAGKALVTLTESPNYNLYGWACRTYEIEGVVRSMINTGYHKSEVWMSVLFQLLVALYVLQKHQIAFNEFSLEDNVYIKDTTTHQNITRYWKYNIDGLDYYIPNYGYLVLIDSNFKDVKKSHFTISHASQKDKKFKIYSNVFSKDGADCYTQDDIDNMSFNNFVNCFNTNSFTTAFTNVGGTKPPENILTLIGKINSEATNTKNKQLNHYIHKFMRSFLNNRIGTYLNENESKNVRMDEHREFIKGEVVVHQVHHNTYKYALYLGPSETGQAKIYTKNNPKENDIYEKKFPIGSIYHYANNEQISQNYKAHESNLNEEELLETYTI